MHRIMHRPYQTSIMYYAVEKKFPLEKRTPLYALEADASMLLLDSLLGKCSASFTANCTEISSQDLPMSQFYEVQ